jgi:hypothetical protein
MGLQAGQLAPEVLSEMDCNTNYTSSVLFTTITINPNKVFYTYQQN